MLRTTEGGAVEAADMGPVEGIMLGENQQFSVQELRDLSLARQLPSCRFVDCRQTEDGATSVPN